MRGIILLVLLAASGCKTVDGRPGITLSVSVNFPGDKLKPDK